jgi:hypothetical protein
VYTTDYKGEELTKALHLENVQSKEFSGVMVYKFWGTEGGIKRSTDILTEYYPLCSFDTLADAVWLGKMQIDGVWEDLYELILMRSVK